MLADITLIAPAQNVIQAVRALGHGAVQVVGAVKEDGGALICTNWAARRLATPVGQGGGLRAVVAAALGEGGRINTGLAAEAATELEPLAGSSAITRRAALFHLWRSLDERLHHLPDLEAAALGARIAGHGGLAILAGRADRVWSAYGRREP